VLINKFAYGALIHLFGLKKWTKVEMMEYFSFISVLKIYVGILQSILDLLCNSSTENEVFSGIITSLLFFSCFLT
jgi:hypothetical protein